LPRIYSAEAHLHHTFGAIEKAEASLLVANEIATQQCAKGSQLHVVIHLARLWRSQGKVQQARELLAPIYGWFTEGFDTRDLKEAKVLLEELAS
jgi:predicted ATPase